ncbi:hypothetical protein [Chryseolinea soli]|uniref:PilN domain-containing protein n=1 Tax=Chryseolinea soli TaxID=2321403 RepID=A0A385SE12_9BACT|nr:hypothetical protein [Chryseolinea soli]AYB29204.1 hypothetical protein D4L85_00775 [Chryseolinea soli]
MSIRSIINFEEASNTSIGVNFLYGASETFISYCVLQKQKGEVTLVKSKAQLESTEQLISELGPYLLQDIRIHVNVEGRGVLTKEVPKPANQQAQDLFSIFPGVKEQDFIAQGYSGAETEFCSLLRKEFLESNVFYKRYGKRVVSISLGKFIFGALIPFLEKGPTVSLPDATIHISENKIQKIDSAISTTSSSILVGTQQIDGECGVAYGAALSIFLGTSELVLSGITETDYATELFDAKKSVFKTARLALLLLLGVLLCNALVFFKLKGDVSEMTSEISQQEVMVSGQHKQLKEAAQIEKIYNGLGWSENSQPIWYADQLASTLTNEIELSNLQIGVVDAGRLRKDKQYFFQSAQILVRGYSSEAAAVTAWLSKVETLPWVDHVEGQTYRYDGKSKMGLFEFAIHVK